MNIHIHDFIDILVPTEYYKSTATPMVVPDQPRHRLTQNTAPQNASVGGGGGEEDWQSFRSR